MDLSRDRQILELEEENAIQGKICKVIPALNYVFNHHAMKACMGVGYSSTIPYHGSIWR
jgi:hypothetical protein